jgi:hypothetical protein
VAQPVLYVHVSQRRSGPVVELWTYYPDSRTDHLPVAVMQGYHHDDWEGLLVAFDAAGRVLGARATAHAGFNGTTPWWDESRENWAPYGGVAYRASGSHAVGLRRADIDLAGDGWSGDLATIPPAAFRLLAADRAAVWARPFSAEVAPPWRKSAWSDPGVRGTGESGDGRSRLARAARAWARGEHVVGALPLDPAEQRVEAPTG